MDDAGGIGIRNWGYYEQPLKSSLGLQLMSPVEERDTKPFLPNGGFIHRECGVPQPSVPMEFIRDGWIHQNREAKMHLVLPMNHSYHVLPEHPVAHTLQMLQPPNPPTEEKVPMMMDDPILKNNAPSRKRGQGPTSIAPKQKKPKKSNGSGQGSMHGLVSRGKSGKNTSLVINGIDFDISGIPTPVCSCTGTPQQCYRWGVGGWQSACCTTSISVYPLPLNMKRRGARIAGRKMSLGAFKKVLEKLAGEGHNVSNPIDLRAFWAKHGTNKFVTIR